MGNLQTGCSADSCTNVIAIIAIVGITVVPCLYAWFNIDGQLGFFLIRIQAT